jgi:hypothetical protein
MRSAIAPREPLAVVVAAFGEELVEYLLIGGYAVS